MDQRRSNSSETETGTDRERERETETETETERENKKYIFFRKMRGKEGTKRGWEERKIERNVEIKKGSKLVRKTDM